MDNNQSFITLFKSVEYAKSYLKQRYQSFGFSSPTELAFKNGYTLVYYINMGETYFQQGKSAPLSIQPVLYFYGLSNWLKGALLTIDPDYPATTQVLAHGVSTRKKKKQGYRFLDDEIKVQKDGLFPFISNQLFNMKQLTGEKYKMKHLLMIIPELNKLFETLEKDKPLFIVESQMEKSSTANKREYMNLDISDVLLKKINLTPKQFEKMVKEKIGTELICKELNKHLIITVNAHSLFPPVYKNMENQFFIPSHLPLYFKIPELMSHYLILYNLSMICRYEIEWWGELLYSFSNNDLSFIDAFLNITKVKSPLLLQSLFFHDFN
ncbi:YaaC family protein [Evansella tamaricis]|uniref:YaaC family protein n=1 Tax=Evansella tamaricis TaxID=2069301 RepID=A0ABS6JDQ4_9BACI|nr:YaaC family protein [Evansella tamaricis]MBU9711799.1 YaaC family protein [Evansella tamaricis]